MLGTAADGFFRFRPQFLARVFVEHVEVVVVAETEQFGGGLFAQAVALAEVVFDDDAHAPTLLTSDSTSTSILKVGRLVATNGDQSWDVADLVGQMDVAPNENGDWDGLLKFSESRPVVEGSQLLGQAIVAAMRTTNGRRVVSAHMAFTRVANATIPAPITLREISNGRTMSAYWAQVSQNNKVCAAGTLLLDATAPDVMRHAAAVPSVVGPDAATPIDMGVIGRDVRVVDNAYTSDADAPVGPPVIDAWVRFSSVPDDPAIHAGLLAHFTGHMSIAAAMRPHAHISQSQAHVSLSTGVNAIHLSLHAVVRVDEWLLYHHEVTFSGDGMTHSDCRVHTEAGALVASFSVESMVRGFADAAKAGDARTAM